VENPPGCSASRPRVSRPLLSIFKPELIGNTAHRVLVGWPAASSSTTPIWSLFATHMQRDLHVSRRGRNPDRDRQLPGLLAMDFGAGRPIDRPSLGDDHSGNRHPVRGPLYLLTADLTLIVAGFVLPGIGRGCPLRAEPELPFRAVPTGCARRPAPSATTRGRSSAVGGADPELLRDQLQSGLRRPHAAGTAAGAISFVIALLLGRDQGKELVRTRWWLDGRAPGRRAQRNALRAPRSQAVSASGPPRAGPSFRRAPRRGLRHESYCHPARPAVVPRRSGRHLPAPRARARRPEGPPLADRIGFIGVGRMGGPIGRRFLGAV